MRERIWRVRFGSVPMKPEASMAVVAENVIEACKIAIREYKIDVLTGGRREKIYTMKDVISVELKRLW